MKHTITLEIAGAKYRMSSDADADHLEQLAQTVNAKISALGPRAAVTTAPAQMLAAVALELADDLYAANQRCRQLEELTRDTVHSAIARIEKHIGGEEDGASAPAPATHA